MTENVSNIFLRSLFFEFLSLQWVNSGEQNEEDRFKCRKSWQIIIFAKRMRKYLNAEFICIKGLCASGWWKTDLLKLLTHLCVLINANLLFASLHKMIFKIKIKKNYSPQFKIQNKTLHVCLNCFVIRESVPLREFPFAAKNTADRTSLKSLHRTNFSCLLTDIR